MADRISHSLVAALRRVSLFTDLDDRALLDLVGATCNFSWRTGSTVFDKGAESAALFVVLSGSIRILDVDEGREVEIARIGPGGFFGEQSLLREQTHSKRAVAAEETELMVLAKRPLEELLANRPGLDAQIRRSAEERLADGKRAEPPV
ncbi:MAG: cyclic nucleotide-binding domain-containing protein [Actinomycetota bacterium]|nr:cyclic nucleotide-binding domain-containing protein [Actinomycetota bacterium]